jgi:hypothetical protein
VRERTGTSCPCPGPAFSTAVRPLWTTCSASEKCRTMSRCRCWRKSGDFVRGCSWPGAPGGRRSEELEATIVLVNCGGTGGLVAEALARLMLGRRATLFLVDPDRVAQGNLRRQAFQKPDIGRFKAEVLAEHLARSFGCEVAYRCCRTTHVCMPRHLTDRAASDSSWVLSITPRPGVRSQPRSTSTEACRSLKFTAASPLAGCR